MNSSTTERRERVRDELRSLKWVIRTEETNRSDATHRLVTDQTVIRTDHEVHTLANIGVTVEAFSQAGHYGIHIYVTLP